eukprot:TRINITY_DN2765_c0_g5_i2.p2 TRINITY_DN2765_c0_g5~~TRINITY_DN2765_c0_g5_i2.p2  ORF type:complete len:135 (+),score=7.15 TRINITY_DN2765_c0_g5_i2:172-576(+)
MSHLIFDDDFASGLYIGTVSEKKKEALSGREIEDHSEILSIVTPQGMVYSRWAKSILSQECSMCLEEFTTGDRLRVLHCNHTFHAHCIDAWFQRSRYCPFCLRDITTLPPPQGSKIPSILSPMSSPILKSEEPP